MSVELIGVLIAVLTVSATLAGLIQKGRFLLCLFIGCLGVWTPSLAQETQKVPDTAEIRSIEVDEPGGKILSFRHLAGSTVVQMNGTRIEPTASIKMKVESRPGFLEIDINRGDIRELQPARRFGEDYLTYVLWAVSVDGKASNLGEITFRDGRPVSINVTTPLQTFWLMVTAEPDFAVNDPSPVVVLYSTGQANSQSRALHVDGQLLYYTYYTQYSTSPAAVDRVTPNELQQARKAIELASKAGILGVPTPQGEDPLPGELRIRATLEQAAGYLQQAENGHLSRGSLSQAIQFARTAANIAENARALAIGAVGGINLRQLERELAKLQQNLAERELEFANLREDSNRRNSQLTAQIQELEEALQREGLARDELRVRAEKAEADLVGLRQEINSLRQRRLALQDLNVRLGEDREKICNELRTQLASLGQLTQQGGSMVLTLASDILFDFNSFELRSSARENLAKLTVIRMLLFPGARVRYEGHTDRVGDDDYNEWLSQQRALGVYLYFLDETLKQPLANEFQENADKQRQIVRELLATDYASSLRGITREERLAQLNGTVIGKGESEPVEDTEASSELNRRVVLLFPPAPMGQVTSLCAGAPAQFQDE
jgi:outer membrane protein OmpA-like peptidoglycan-associated protein